MSASETSCVIFAIHVLVFPISSTYESGVNSN